MARQDPEMQKAKQFAFGGQKRFQGGPLNRILFTPVNISIGPCLGAVLKKIQPKQRSKTQFKIMVEYQVPRESIFLPYSSKHSASLALAQHYRAGQTRSRNAKKPNSLLSGAKNDFRGATQQNCIHPCKHFHLAPAWTLC